MVAAAAARNVPTASALVPGERHQIGAGEEGPIS